MTDDHVLPMKNEQKRRSFYPLIETAQPVFHLTGRPGFHNTHKRLYHVREQRAQEYARGQMPLAFQ